jgi:pyruvate kinase
MIKTKIICTLGPSTDDEDILRKMMANMNVARFNFSHGTYEQHKKRVDAVKRNREELGLPIALLLDTKGPEIRTGNFKNKSVELIQGQKFTFFMDEIEGDQEKCSVSYKTLYQEVECGDSILVNDGLIEMVVENVIDQQINCIVKNSGVIGNYKGMHVPRALLKMPAITEKEQNDVRFAIENDFDFIAQSFVRNADDVEQMKRTIAENGGKDIHIIAKIESKEGVENIDEIIQVADAIMVARGDLGVDLQPEEVPKIQKMLIKKCNIAGKPVIIATQMLESMVNNPRPTRAEVSDVANAIYDSASCIMLSGETAAGKYPLESLEMMVRVVKETEKGIDYIERFNKKVYDLPINMTNVISHATCTSAHNLGAKAIISITQSGNTARMVSKFRPSSYIIGVTNSKKVQRQLTLGWGIYPFVIQTENNTDKLFSSAVEKALETGLVNAGDIVILTGGVPVRITGRTNIMKVEVVGEHTHGLE